MNLCYLISTFIVLVILNVGFGQGWKILHSAYANEDPSSVSEDDCFNKPIGVSDPQKIPDRQMTAFGQIDTDSLPAYGRLSGDRGNGWCSFTRDACLQVDLGKPFEICGIATQGDRNGTKWVTDFKVSYLSHGRMWTPYKDGKGKEVEFHRKGENKTVDQHKLPVSVSARYVRFHPARRVKENCLRVEIYGFASKPVKKEKCVALQEKGDESLTTDIEYVPMKWFETPSIVALAAACTGEEALGLASGLVTDQQMSASSSRDKDQGPENARLNFTGVGPKSRSVWKTDYSDQDPFLQVDFWRNVKITKFQTQGYHQEDWWVKSYTLSYSVDGSPLFQTYQENSADKVFTGNSDRDSIVTHVLLQPIIARYVQIKPIAWKILIGLRLEFSGCVLSDRYQVLGRKVHMDYVHESLKTKKKVSFQDAQERSNNIDLEILADTIYVKGHIKMRGIKKLSMYSREVVFLKGSTLNLRAPELKQEFQTLPPSSDGDDGKHGVNGAIVEIFADTAVGRMTILTSGGDGKQGQDGSNGKKGADNKRKRPDKTWHDCRYKEGKGGDRGTCPEVPGTPGYRGKDGEDGGYAGYSGNGGDAGRQTISVKRVQGHLNLITCRGTGGAAAKNGVGGDGGQGGRGGSGIKCLVDIAGNKYCHSDGRKTAEAPHGSPGAKGSDGKTPVSPGSDGQVESSYLQKLNLSRSAKGKYPLALIKLMTRYGEDLIWANKITKAETVLKFIVTLTEGRSDAFELRIVAKRRLGFLNKKGFDRFGRNELFAPVMRWEVMKRRAEKIKDYAMPYENAYNKIQESVQRKDDIREVLKTLPGAAKTQVDNQKKRLVEARRIAISQKGVYVQSIKEFESSMKSSLEEITAQLPDVYTKSQFNLKDLFVILQGLTGFASGIIAEDPLESIAAALEVAGHFATKCNTGSLQNIMKKTKKWLKFSKDYAALKDSSDLDFDKMDVESVPEAMKANLEMNMEGLAADLVCMLDDSERSLARDSAKLQEQIKRFFIAGSSRIDLIGKVMDLDNDIGGHNFDIRNLEETSNAIKSFGESGDAPIADNIQQTFLDDLLTSYKQLETSFAMQLLDTFKGFEFRTLWDVEDDFFQFQRTASEIAKATGNLQGILQLCNSLQNLDTLGAKTVQCFSKFHYTSKIHKWSFDNITNAAMFDQLHQGNTSTFTLKLSHSCDRDECYNARLLKMYVELYGNKTQDEKSLKLPANVFLSFRHLSWSIFRDSSGEPKVFHQPLASQREFVFNRFAITNTEKCIKETKKGKKDSLFCMEENDQRFQPMCCHFLSDSPCDDTRLGALECKSPFGTYEISMPINDKAPCSVDDTKMTSKNCKDFDRTIYTNMNVWIRYLYWSKSYPTGPDDPKCGNFKAAKTDQATPDYFNS